MALGCWDLKGSLFVDFMSHKTHWEWPCCCSLKSKGSHQGKTMKEGVKGKKSKAIPVAGPEGP
jgi:hypothetical protein